VTNTPPVTNSQRERAASLPGAVATTTAYAPAISATYEKATPRVKKRNEKVPAHT
jgi:hypothetical protein